MPVYYNYKPKARGVPYRDIASVPLYSFGYGLSYTAFSRANFHTTTPSPLTFSSHDMITFHVTVKNTGTMAGSDVPQVYLLQRVSSVVQPVKQLVSFARVYLEPGEAIEVTMDLDPARFLLTLNREWKWEVERGEYTFALLEDSAVGGDTGTRITLTCVG